MIRRCTYGPVPSRRLGLSLGVDLVPYKVCCYDCLYCQVGRTSDLTVSRRDFIDPDEVAREVEEALRTGGRAECVTLSGSGEPTLHQGLREVAGALRRVTPLPLVLLTNGGLLWQPEVAEAARAFDVVAPTLTAADPETFSRLNRPHAQIDHARMWSGLSDFCRGFGGTLRLEVMLVRGVNDSPEALRQLAAKARDLGPVLVDLNTVVRPPAYPEAAPLDAAALESARQLFEQAGCRASVIASPPSGKGEAAAPRDLTRARVLETVSRRPCTLDDLTTSLGIAADAVAAAVEEARAAGELDEEEREGRRYFRARR
jgi:wyosine [tRNA(Phe)-imidazoG37] synthetase (radical SAM superfamily)